MIKGEVQCVVQYLVVDPKKNSEIAPLWCLAMHTATAFKAEALLTIASPANNKNNKQSVTKQASTTILKISR